MTLLVLLLHITDHYKITVWHWNHDKHN